ncbi:MAG: hypothetical protein D6762_07960 [Candidatus Neomarinimicrobiota bacterium]|nr:MAG: hypothetical protein D6762_07960 [Candidatus Neomarinimicrobiota bacterium]
MRNLLGIQAGHHQGKWSGYLRTRVQATRFTLYDALLRAEYRNPTSHRLRVSAEFQTRTPRIAENSIFSVFEAYNSQELRVRLERQIQGDLNGRIALRQVWFHQESATILTLGASRQHTALAWIWQDGYGGTSNRLQLTTQGTWKGLFLAGRASLGNYRLLEGTLEDLATYSVTAEYPLSKRLVFRGDVQWLRNRYYARDVRFLAGLRVRI